MNVKKYKITTLILGVLFVIFFTYWSLMCEDFDGIELSFSASYYLTSMLPYAIRNHLPLSDDIFDDKMVFSCLFLLAAIIWLVLWILSCLKKPSIYTKVFTVFNWAFSTSFILKLRLDNYKYGIIDHRLNVDLFRNITSFHISWAFLIAIGIINLIYLRKESKQLSTRIV